MIETIIKKVYEIMPRMLQDLYSFHLRHAILRKNWRLKKIIGEKNEKR
tara:strand:- start:148 stop:291 length:144 start_codon:yes stop_codon:yes gene_type:complete